jgi:hypothetical protein
MEKRKPLFLTIQDKTFVYPPLQADLIGDLYFG